MTLALHAFALFMAAVAGAFVGYGMATWGDGPPYRIQGRSGHRIRASVRGPFNMAELWQRYLGNVVHGNLVTLSREDHRALDSLRWPTDADGQYLPIDRDRIPVRPV